MSIELLGLGKFLKIAFSRRQQQISLLRSDINDSRKKEAGLSKESGRDFYGPFWADAKNHVAGKLDLRTSVPARIADSPQNRARLYPLLQKGFLTWWEEKRRNRNEAFTLIEDSIKARYKVSDIGILKIENIFSITIGDSGHRILYPYFCEDPSLCDEAARIGLWVMEQSIKTFKLEDMRLLDVFAARSYSTIETKMMGNEEELLIRHYKFLRDEWIRLKSK